MKRVGHLLTLLLGMTLSLITLLLFLDNERQRDELVSLSYSQFQTIQQAWYMSGSDGKEQYLYPLKQVFYLNRYEVKDTEHLQQALRTKKVSISRPAQPTPTSDLYIRFDNGKEMAIKVMVEDEQLFLMDQKTMQYYQLPTAEVVGYFRWLNEESRMPLLLFIIYTILFFSIAYLLAKKLIGGTSKNTPTKLIKQKGKRLTADFLLPIILPLIITISMQIYGAQHSLLLLSVMMLTSGIREYVEKRELFMKMVLLLLLFLFYLHGFQWIISYFN
ncbi:hypothetical protein [Lysinibacillus fusiformis]|uniref:hypothetical protein n=1 Tax=Lysinibacillus fusiformis TaxID=28031 RepID=UPI000469E508|nr:hypothetical protein [Lysinibacillus fusiformis]